MNPFRHILNKEVHFSFWQQMIIIGSGFILMVLGMALFEMAVWLTVVFGFFGALVVFIGIYGTRDFNRNKYIGPRNRVREDNIRKKDLPFNPWDEVQKTKK